MNIKKSARGTLTRLLVVFVLSMFIAVPVLTFNNTANNTALAATNYLTVYPSTTKVFLNDGTKASCSSCNINGNNYFKLRDIAYLLSGSELSFNVTWDASKNSIKLTTNHSYTKVGSEFSATNFSEMVRAKGTTTKIYINTNAVYFTCYNISGSTYFKLRDLGSKLGFDVNWSDATISISPSATELKSADELATQAEMVLFYTNKERANVGLSKLIAVSYLEEAAAIRAQEIATSFSHTRPDGTTCFTVLDDLNIDYSVAGENLAMGQPDAESVVKAWMNSPGHKANILDSEFTKLGIGVYEDSNGTMYWSQEFLCN